MAVREFERLMQCKRTREAVLRVLEQRGRMRSIERRAEDGGKIPAEAREAALQGLAKMQRLRALGLSQGVLPPHERPIYERTGLRSSLMLPLLRAG